MRGTTDSVSIERPQPTDRIPRVCALKLVVAQVLHIMQEKNASDPAEEGDTEEKQREFLESVYKTIDLDGDEKLSKVELQGACEQVHSTHTIYCLQQRIEAAEWGALGETTDCVSRVLLAHRSDSAPLCPQAYCGAGCLESYQWKGS